MHISTSPQSLPISIDTPGPRAICSESPKGIPEDIFLSVCHQYRAEHELPNRPGYVSQATSYLLGQTLTRRVSNFFSCFGLSQFLPAQRDYPTLPQSELNDQLAQRFTPKLSTIRELKCNTAELKPSSIRYEILPPQEDRPFHSIIYYIGMPLEKLPIPVIGKLYDWARPVLYGSQKDWEAVQIDVDLAGNPIGMSFETSNYTNSPDSFNLITYRDLHLFSKIEKRVDGVWTQTIQQKNGLTQVQEIADPFKENTHPDLCLVSWNGQLDLSDRVKQKPDLKVNALEAPKPEFLDIETYRKEGIDLRATWLKTRKFGKFMMKLPGRTIRPKPLDPASLNAPSA
ncbi:MAG: hypothetical protein V4534_03060 [Myxococcota bacterium]